MAISHKNGVALTGLSAVNGVTSISALNGVSATLGGGSTLKTNLVAYYDMAGTGNLTDLHGSKTLTLNGTIGSVTGPVSGEFARGKANTSSANYFERADDTDFEPGANPFSISLWLRTDDVNQDSWTAVFSKFLSGDNQREWLVLMNGSGGSDAGKFTFGASNNGTSDVGATTGQLSANTWHYLGMCWDGTDLKISVNGGSFVSTAFAGPVFASTSAIRMFTRFNGGPTFRGDVGPTAFWKGRALTLAEFQSIYNSGAGLPYSSW